MTPELIQGLLFVLGILLTIVTGILINAFCRNVHPREQFSVIFLGIVTGILAALAAEAFKNPQADINTYTILGVGYFYCLGLITLFSKAWSIKQEDDRTKILEFVRKEVTNRLQAMGVSDQQISVRAKPEKETFTNPLQVVQNLPGGKFIASTVKFIHDSWEQVIPPGTPIIDTFNQEAAKKLLILGAPGSGKTTALLTLARQLYEAAEKDKSKPIPIILELSSWQPSEKILDWIAMQLKAKYRLPEPRCKQFLQGGEFVLLLDGLDELKNQKDSCIDAINKFRTIYRYESQQLVVCSRLEDYKETTQKLDIPGCYALQPLSDEEIENYLKTHWIYPLWAKLKADPDGFLKLARQPLLLDLIRKTYTDNLLPFPVLTPNPDPEQYQKACQEKLLADYVEHQLEENHHHQGYDPRKTKHYIEWLAKNLKREKTTEFLLENMQPSWLEPNKQKGYRIAIGLIVTLILGLITMLIFGLYEGSVLMLLGLKFGLKLALEGTLDDIEPYEVLNLNLSTINPTKIYEEMVGGIVGIAIIISGIISGLIAMNIVGNIVGLVTGLIVGSIIGMMVGLVKGLQSNLRLRDKPNQGIWNSGQKAMILTVLPYLFALSLFTLPSLAANRPVDISYVLLTSLSISLFSGIFFGGGFAFIQHFVLRYFLIQAGHIPRDYVGFLKYAEERGLILQNGGSFRFYHDLLREHLAGNT